MSVKILPAFRLKRSDLRERVRSWADEQFSYPFPGRADSFIDAAKPILKDAGIPSKEMRREWAKGEQSEWLPRLRDRVMDQIEYASEKQLDGYAKRLGLA